MALLYGCMVQGKYYCALVDTVYGSDEEPVLVVTDTQEEMEAFQSTLSALGGRYIAIDCLVTTAEKFIDNFITDDDEE